MLIRFYSLSIIICLHFLFGLNQINAQVSVTPYVGLNWTTLKGYDVITNKNYTGEFGMNIPRIGIEAKRKIHKKGELGLELSYRPSSYFLLTDNTTSDFIQKIKYYLKYFDVSANYNFSVNDNFYLTGSVGFSYLLKESRKWMTSGNYTDAPDANTYPKRDYNVALGFGYNLKKVNLRLKYNLGLAMLDRDGKARLIQFDIGYRIIN